jgi:hypothetical protein
LLSETRQAMCNAPDYGVPTVTAVAAIRRSAARASAGTGTTGRTIGCGGYG